MTTNEMKTILQQKLQEEKCYFEKSDISIKKVNANKWEIVIKDYEHILFTMTTEKDDYFGNIVYIHDGFEEKNIVFVDSKEGYNFKVALVRLGYYIGTRF